MVRKNSFVGKFLITLSKIDDFLRSIGEDFHEFLDDINKAMERLSTILREDIPGEMSEYKQYRRRICHLCGLKVPKGEGMESYSSFILYHDECFEKVREMQDYQ